jgi:geranylgeranyl reductase family protein
LVVEPDPDLIVVGAGPAGSRAVAAALAGGLRVTQFDAAPFPRTKPCAGGLTPRALAALPRAEVAGLTGEYHEFAFNAWRGARTVYSCRARLLAMVSRPELDRRLVEENRAHPGLTFRPAESVRSVDWTGGRFVVRTARRTVRARQLVGADGANGVVGRTLGGVRPRGRAVALEVVVGREELLGEPDLAHPVFDFGALERGYGWVFPKQGEVCIGLYSLARGHRDLPGRLDAYARARGLAPRSGSWPVFEAHTIPVGGHGAPRPSGPLYMVGDAAALADALTGEGIYHALESGRIAGETAVLVARGEAGPERFAIELERRVVRDTRWSWRIAGPFYRHPEWALRGLARSPLWRALVQGTGEGATFSECLRHAPRLALRSLWTGSARRVRTS